MTRATRRPLALTVTLCLLVVALAAPAVSRAEPDGKLSADDWKAKQQALIDAIQQKSEYGIAEALRGLAEDESARAVKLICKALPKTGWGDQSADGGADAFAKLCGASDDARAEIHKAARKDKDWRTRILCVDAIAKTARDEADWAVIAEALDKDKKDEVRIAAAQALARSRRDEAVDPMIATMTDLDKKKGPVWEALKACLAKLVGTTMDAGIDYKNFWEARKANPDLAAPESGEGGGMSSVTFFGREITCTHPVFIIDISGSMNSIDPPSRNSNRLRTSPEVDPLDPSNSRIERAKRELIKVLKGLPKSTKFNICAYSSDVSFFRDKGLHALNSSNVDAAVKWVTALKAEGVTVTDDAIARTYDQIKEARCFYLLSDGFATHDGTTRVPTEQILSMIREKNRFRRITINTLGFPEADVEMMQAVASETGGSYSNIDE